MDRASFLWLFALLCLLVFVALDPLLSYAVFGSDTGEYYRLSSTLAATGHVPTGGAYTGWGFAYPDFPGLFVLAAASAQAMGTPVISALLYVTPVVAVLSLLPLFLLFRRILPSDRIALLGAGLASVAMPRMFSLAHPAPLALGDFLVVGALWMFVEGRRDRRWYVPLGLSLGALVVTHHLSSYFFLVAALGSLLLLELVEPGRWSRRFPLRELVLLAAFAVGLLSYWSEYATSFRTILAQGLGPAGSAVGPLLVAGAVVGVGAAGAVIRWRRSHVSVRHRPYVRFPSDRSLAIDAGLILAATFVGVGLLLLFPLPGTSQHTNASAILFFTPLLVTIALAAGTRRLLSWSRLGPWAVALLVALSFSTIAALLSPNGVAAVIPPGRHVEYLLIPLGMLSALGLGRLIARAGDVAGRKAVVAGGLAAVLVLGANAAIAYPPQSDLGGFQEGLTDQDAALWMWVGSALPPTAVVATDHRLSSMIFGFDGLRATWQSTPNLLVGPNWTAALLELHSAPLPRPPGAHAPISAIALDPVMRTGVALDPNQLALPMSPQAVAWFNAPPFLPLYENGPYVVYWVEVPGPPGP